MLLILWRQEDRLSSVNTAKKTQTRFTHTNYQTRHETTCCKNLKLNEWWQIFQEGRGFSRIGALRKFGTPPPPGLNTIINSIFSIFTKGDILSAFQGVGFPSSFQRGDSSPFYRGGGTFPKFCQGRGRPLNFTEENVPPMPLPHNNF